MEKLVEGLHKFYSDVFRIQRDRFVLLAQDQRPRAMVISCADSRINLNLLTQTDLGELFILRNAGNIVPPYGTATSGEAATIEYAVMALGVKDIIVCGHSHCGAMKGLLNPEHEADLPAVSAWLTHALATRRIVKEKYPNLEGEALSLVTTETNVLVQLDHLRTHPAVAARLAQGKLTLHGWVYRLETGDVLAYHPEENQFISLETNQPEIIH